MMQKVISFLMIFFIAVLIFSFDDPGKPEVNWISIKELNEMYSKDPKPILVDVYTDWCGWCKEMDRKTYKNEKVVNYINEHYYAVKLNAESPDSMVFNNRQFGYKAKYKSNELAEYLLYRQMEFPTTVFLPTIDARPAPLPGYLSVKDIEAPLKYFGEGFHKKQTFVEYNQSAKKEW
jgi:thioredoxin-related protein